MPNDNPWAVVSTAPAPNLTSASPAAPSAPSASAQPGDNPWAVASTTQAPDTGGDGVLANHPTLQKFDRGLKTGTAQGFGLKPDAEGNVGFFDAVGQTLGNLKKSAIQSFHNLGGDDATLTGGDQKPQLGKSLLTTAAVAGTPFDMIGTGINGMATGIEDSSKDVIAGIKSGDHEVIGRGVGKLLATLGQLGLGMEGSAATDVIRNTAGAVADKAGTALEDNATRPANGLVRAKTQRSFSYGKNPGQTIIDEKIKPTNDLDNLQSQVSKAQNNISSQVKQVLSDPAVAARSIDAVKIIDQKLGEAKNALASESGLTNRQNVIDALNQVREDIVNNYDPDGKVIGHKGGPRTLAETTEIKQSVGSNTRWNADPELNQYVNSFKKSVYGALNDAIESEVQAAKGPNAPLVQSVKALNKRQANAMEFQRLLKDRIVKEANGDTAMSSLFKKGEYWKGLMSMLGGAGALSTHPVAGGMAALGGAGMVAREALRSPIGRVARARGMDAVGKGLQSGADAIRSDTGATVAQGAAIAGSSAAQSTGHKIGDTIVQGGQTFKVTRVDSNGLVLEAE
jgi:hypothetical protein